MKTPGFELITYDEQLKTLGFSMNKFEDLKSYLDLLWQSNEELNLISRKMTPQELIENHVLDCLLPLKFFPIENVNKVADFGSGGGLPAVIYAIQFPHIEFHLYEKSPKKQQFLKRCQEIAPNLMIHGEIPLKNLNVDLVTARGFKPLNVILELSLDFYSNKGKYFLLKGRLEKINEEISEIKKIKNIPIKIQNLKSPLLEVERNLVLINC